MIVCLDRRRSVRFFFSFEKATLELNFIAMKTMFSSAMHVNFTHFVVRARLHSIPRREATSRSVKLFHELFQVVDRIVTKSTLFVSGILMVRSLVLMHVPS